MSDIKTSAIVNSKVLVDEGFISNHSVIVRDEVIADVIPDDDVPSTIDQVYDLGGNYLTPGFIDLQVNGGGGVMFNSEPSIESIKRIGSAHRQFGTTGFMPTLITDKFEVMIRAIAAVDEAIKEGVPGVLGIHLEGPFLNEQKKGVHDASKFCVLDDHGFEIVTSLRSGKTIVTLAPELTTSAMISKIRSQGVIVCAGHSNADYEQSRSAIDAGVTGFTHLFNAMTQLGSREPGMVGAALSSDDTWFGIIADGHHIHDASLKIALRAKSPRGAILVTDAMAAVGSDEKSFVLDGEKIFVVDGRCTNASGALAGSDLDMNQAIKNVMRRIGIDFTEAVRMASLYPAMALGVDDQYGKIHSGYLANLVAIDANFNVTGTWMGEGHHWEWV